MRTRTITVQDIEPDSDRHRLIKGKAYLAAARELLRLGREHTASAAALTRSAHRLMRGITEKIVVDPLTDFESCAL